MDQVTSSKRMSKEHMIAIKTDPTSDYTAPAQCPALDVVLKANMLLRVQTSSNSMLTISRLSHTSGVNVVSKVGEVWTNKVWKKGEPIGGGRSFYTHCK